MFKIFNRKINKKKSDVIEDHVVNKANEHEIKENNKKSVTLIDTYCLKNIKEYWISGYPLLTDYGFVKSIKIKDNIKFANEIEFLKLQDWQVKKHIINFLEDNDQKEDAIKMFKENSFITCVKNDYQNLRKTYVSILNIFFIGGFNSDLFYLMTQKEFDDLRYLILDFNGIPYRKVNPNEEIDRFDRMKYYIAQSRGLSVTFDTMYTTLMTKEGGGHTPEEIDKFTMRQFMHAFKRVEFVKGNEVSTLYKTVDANNKVEVVQWFESTLDVKENEKMYGSIEELKRSSNAFMNK